MAETIQLDVSLGLQQAISQAESLRRVLQQSVKPDSSAYRVIESMLNKATQQAEMFKQTMGDSLKTSSGTKTFTNKLQQTINLLGTASERLSNVKGKDLIFSENDLQRTQQLESQIKQINENITNLKKAKIDSFFSDTTTAEFKQLQSLAEKLNVDLNKVSFSDFQNTITKELKTANGSIDSTKEKVKQLDNVLKNTNITDVNKLSQTLNTKAAASTIDVFKADNLDEANTRLQNFYRGFSDYIGKMKSKISEGDSVSKVIETENKAITSNISRQIAELNNYKKDLEAAFNTLQGISGHKKGQGYDYKRSILAETGMQDIFKAVGFDEALANTGDPAGFITRAREAIQQALEKVKVDSSALVNLRDSMKDALKNVFADLETDKVIGDSKGLRQALSDWLGGEGVELKNNALVQAFDSIKNKADAAVVVNTFVTALQRYITTIQQLKTEYEGTTTEQEQYTQALQEGNNILQSVAQLQQDKINTERQAQESARREIENVNQAREASHRSAVAEASALDNSKNSYNNLIQALRNYNAELMKTEARTAAVNNIRTAITNWMGFNQVMQLTKRAVSEAINHIKQLDTTMNGIAIVTDMTTADLWKQVDAYSDMAQNFGVTIQGAYEVSKIYYQAGYETNEVLTLTNETLKLAKISGLDYATTTDYMMTAMRGFKLEMEDASHVVDVYSNLAANTAVSQQELAEAMTRTASSMESVGATFEETSAMIATMVAVTRESANNIGSAMKSIASRYGELTKDPTALFDAEGEAMSFNKVDEALRSVGITLQTTDHQFRDFTDVILELADKWDTLDSAAQRYIATQFAGNRQQSRFLALVGNVDLLRENIANAENSEDVGTLQALKALDSLESKLNQVQVAYQQFYTTIGIENVWKGLLDGTTNVINTLNGLPKVFGAVPLNAAAMAYTVISLLKNVVLNGFSALANAVLEQLNNSGNQIVIRSQQIGEDGGRALVLGYEKGSQNIGQSAKNSLERNLNSNTFSKVLSTIGSLSVMFGALIDKTTDWGRALGGITTTAGGVAQAVGGILQGIATQNWAAVAMQIGSGLLNIFNGISIFAESAEERLERLTKEAENLNNEAKKAKAEYNTLDRAKKKVEELEQKRYDSVEAAEEYKEAVNELANQFPQLIENFDGVGNAIYDVEAAEDLLIATRREAAKAAQDAAEAERARIEADIENSSKQARNLLTKAADSDVSFNNEEIDNQPGVGREVIYDNNGKLYAAIQEVSKYDENGNWISSGPLQGLADMLFDLSEYFNEEYTLADFVENPERMLGMYERLGNDITDLKNFEITYYDTINTATDLLDEFNALNEIAKTSNLTDPEIQNKFLDLDQRIQEYRRNGHEDFLSDFYEENSNWLQFIDSIGEIQTKQLTKVAADRQLIGSTLDRYNEEMLDSKYASARRLAIAELERAEGELSFDDYTQVGQKYVQLFDNLGEAGQEKLNNILNNLDKYTLNEVYSELDIEDTTSDYAQSIASIYNQINKNINELVANKVKNHPLLEAITERGNFNSTLGLNLITEGVELLNTYSAKNGFFETYYEVQDVLINLYKALENADSGLRTIVAGGFSTINELENAISTIKAGDFGSAGEQLVSILTQLKETLPYNYNAAIIGLTDNISKSFETDKKEIDKLAKGFDAVELNTFLDSALNKNAQGESIFSIDDFIADIKGVYTTTPERLNDFWEAYKEKVLVIPEEIQKFNDTILNNTTEELIDKFAFKSDFLSNLGFGDDYAFSQENITDVSKGSPILKQAINNYKENLKKFQENIDNLYLNPFLDILFDAGNYSFLDYDLTAEIRKGINIKRDDPILQYAVEKASTAINTFLNDAFEQGVDNLDAKLYALPTDIPEATTNLNLLEAFTNYYNTQSQTWNDMVLKALEADRATSDGGIVESALKDVTFIKEDVAYASADTLRQIADAFHANVLDLFDPNDYDSILGGYRVKLENFDATGIDLTGISNGLSMMADSIQSYLKSIADLISKGIKGSMTYADRDSLISALKNEYNYDLGADAFKQTEEGLKLSADEASRLYNYLKQVDSVRANLIFDDLKDSLTEAGEECENISTTLAAIARLEAELQQPENANNQILRDRLALYKDIAAAQTSDPNQFKFMDRNLPNGMQGPENYWNSVGKAYTAMNNAKSTGYMEIQDFYNIVNEMANLVEMSGGRVELMGMNFENAAEMSATLIEQGMSALTNIDGKGVKISMAQLGEDFGIGVDDMAKGFDDGIKEMARSQIKMLDAQIALLEAVVAMEGLGEIDVDGIEGFSFGDVFKDEDQNGLYEFTEGYAKWANQVLETAKTNEDLARALDSISFNGQTLRNMLANGTTDMEMTEEEAQQYFAAVNSLYQMFLSGEYVLQDLMPSIMRVAEASHFEGEITIGDDKIYITQGTMLEWDKEKSVWKTPGGKEFPTVEAAADYLMLTKEKVDEKNIKEIKGKNGETVGYTGTLTIGKKEIEVTSSNGELSYHSSNTGKDYSSLDDLFADEFKLDPNKDHNITLEEWKITQGYTIVPELKEVESIDLSKAQNVVGKSLEELKKELEESGELSFEAKYGFKLTNETTEEDLNKLKELVGVESKTVDLKLNVIGDNTTLGNLLNEETPSKNIDVTLTDVSKDSNLSKLIASDKPTLDATLNITGVNYGNETGFNNGTNGGLSVNLGNTSSTLQQLHNDIEKITQLKFDNFAELDSLLAGVQGQVSAISAMVETFNNIDFSVNLTTNVNTNTSGSAPQSGTVTASLDTSPITAALTAMVTGFSEAAGQVSSNLETVANGFKSVDNATSAIQSLSDAVTSLSNLQSNASAAATGISSAVTTVASTASRIASAASSISRGISSIPSGTKSFGVQLRYSVARANAKGNVALVNGTENVALATGTPTLMGELGPELVVSHGHYFVVGTGGAEFVNLDKDAIVFNHKQTKRLMQNGSINSRGVPFTNEMNALSFVKGGLIGRALSLTSNVGPKKPTAALDLEGRVTTTTPNRTNTNSNTKTTSEKISGVSVYPQSSLIHLYNVSYAKGSRFGPAMATAAQALAQLKQIRAMWQSMLDASAKDLGSLAGGSGGGKKGGGGGGGSDKEDTEKPWQQKTTTAEIQRWYNLIRQIAEVEKEISYEESLQSKFLSDRIINGKLVYKSYKDELAMLQREIGANQELAALQKSWYDAKRADLAASDYGKIFTYDENGLQQYVGSGAPGTGLGLDILENLTRQDVYGHALDNAATAQQQLAYLRSVGFNTENLKYNEDGTLIDFSGLEGEEVDNAYVQMMENFWSNLDGWRDELDSIYDSYHEQLESVLSNQSKQNEIFQKIVDNQLEVEKNVLDAIESREQKRIDDARDEREALADSADKFLKGLSDQLERERQMYQNNTNDNELNQLRRQLDILVRTGGSATQIKNLRDQIAAKTQEQYFAAQQEQIDAAQRASDEQLERLDIQIDLMTKTLEYQKENGLLWNEVYAVMARTPEQIQEFIMYNTPDFQSNSALQVSEDLRELRSRVEQWIEYRQDKEKNENPINTYSNNWDTFFNAVQGLYKDLTIESIGAAKSAYEQELAKTGDTNKAAQAADKVFSNYRKSSASQISSSASASTPTAGPAKPKTSSTSSTSYSNYDSYYPSSNYDYGGYSSYDSWDTGSSYSSYGGGGLASQISGYLREGDRGSDVGILQSALNGLGYSIAVDNIFGSETKKALKSFQKSAGISSDGILGPDTKAAFAARGYKKGGLVDYTGLAMVHGTPGEPESFFDADDTKLLKEDLLMRKQLLPTLLSTYNNITQNNPARSLSVNNDSNSTVIERVELNLNIQELSNDYDARRAADTIMERLMDVSRRSGNIGINRR